MRTVLDFLTRTKGRKRLSVMDVLTYLYLLLGTFLMFGPVVWLVLSSFKTQAEIQRFPPRLLPYRQETVIVPGYDQPLDLYLVTFEDGTTRELAQVRRVGIEAQMIDPANPEDIIRVNINQRTPVEYVYFGLENYQEGDHQFQFPALSVEQRRRHRSRHHSDPAHQQHGGFCFEQIPVPRARCDPDPSRSAR